MPHTDLPGRIRSLDAYSPGLSIDEIRQKYNLPVVIKMASNENPLGCSPLVQQVIARKAPYAFRYPQSGNPRLCEALAERHKIDKAKIAIGNGSDEIIDLLMRILCEPRKHSIACFEPCFSIYPIQAQINGLETRRCADAAFNRMIHIIYPLCESERLRRKAVLLVWLSVSLLLFSSDIKIHFGLFP